MEEFETSFTALLGAPPPTTTNKQLQAWWKRPVSELIQLAEPEPTAGQAERDRLFALLLLALVYHYFNGNKYGRDGDYPWNEKARPVDAPFLDGDYIGHNIAALAVDGGGNIIDFDFNHNALFNSSAQHAETRLVRRLFALTQIQAAFIATGAHTKAAALHDITVYTTLESCAQCSGVMALAKVERVVYLQTDPGTYLIGNILRNLTDETLRAPLPVAGSEVDLPYFTRLNDAYTAFTAGVKETPFFRRGVTDPRPDHIPSVTSFLCTRAAREIFGAAASDFVRLTAGDIPLQEPNYQDPGTPGGLSNAEALTRGNAFLSYARTSGRRGTPHGS